MNAPSEPSHAAPREVVTVTPTEAWRRQRRGAVLIDVREDHERETGTASGAIGIPLAHLPQDIRQRIPDVDSEILLLCASGQRSLRAAATLRSLGYNHALSVDGGLQRWQADGLAVEAEGLDADAVQRYARQMRLPQIGLAGQKRLARSRVILVGAGGLGSPTALYLAAAGVGHITLVDDDHVERSNLHRQVMHTDARVGQAKVESAQHTLTALNPKIHVEAVQTRLDAGNVDALLAGHDLIVDGADNFPTRYLLSAASVRLRLPLVYAAIERFSGQVSVFDPRDPDSPCYRCLFPEPPEAGAAPNCAEAGVLGVLPGLIGMLQATEALKLLLGIGQPLTGRLLMVNALDMQFRSLALPRDPGCPGCGPAGQRRDTCTIEACST